MADPSVTHHGGGSGAAVVRDNASLIVGGSVVEYTLGGRRYPYKSSARCRICQSPSRMEIEDGILTGRTYRAILRALPVDLTDGDDAITQSTLKNHAENHMPLDAVISRVSIEQKVAAQGRKLEDLEGSLWDRHTLASEIVRRAGESLARGELRPDLSQALAAAKLIADDEVRAAAGADENASDEMLTALLSTLAQMLEPAALRALGTRLRHHPQWVAYMMQHAPEVVEVQALPPAG